MKILKVIYVFELQCLMVDHNNRNLMHCYHEKHIEACDYNYGSALYNARRRFKKMNPRCIRVPPEQIEVLRYRMYDADMEIRLPSKEISKSKNRDMILTMDELLSDYVRSHPKSLASKVTVVDLIKWLQQIQREIESRKDSKRPDALSLDSDGNRLKCPECKKGIVTIDGRICSHGPGPAGERTCLGSGLQPIIET